MQCSEPSSTLTYPMRRLYMTAIAELDDDQLLELVAGAGVALAQHSKDIEVGRERVAKCRALLEAAQTARTLCSVYEERMQESLSGSRAVGFGAAGEAKEAKKSEISRQGKTLPFRPQSNFMVRRGPAIARTLTR